MRTEADGEVRSALQASALSGVLTALRQAPLGIAIFDREMRYLAASSRYLTEQGLPGETPIAGRAHYELFPEVPQRWRDIHAQALRDGAELSHEADSFVRHDGRTDWVRWSVSPWRTDEGEIGGIVLYTEFVTGAVAARARLEAAEARYRAVFDQAAMAVARVAPEGAFLEVNDQFCAMTGYDRDELAQMRFQDITHPGDMERSLAYTQTLLAGEIGTYSIEKRHIAKNGEPLWHNLTVSLVRDGAGTPAYFVTIMYDIGARKRAEAEQKRYEDQLKLMINELNHRVKNTLATVQSMASQTLRGEADPAVAYEKLSSRLLGLSQAHDVLTRERWHGANLDEVIERALKPFVGAAPERVAMSGPAVRLPPEGALSLAMMFHELATNAVKYGAFSVEGGRIELDWSLDRGRLELTWREVDGPPVSPPTRVGFGSRLIERGLRGELKGEAKLTYAPEGLICTIQANLKPES
ncbi:MULTISPECIES: sensor histidine kinase [Phenylobacterium]|uniref:histidine kinase n=1 Tax=Phenylobacterium koreense TaxID=266125 RepID=A0ABV2EDH5_9CAUL